MGTAKAPTTKPAKRVRATPTGKPRGKPAGLPSALLRQVPGEGDGTTVHDVIVRWLRVGADVSVAAAKAFVARSSVYDWLHEGARLAQAIETGARKDADLAEGEAAVLRFAMAALHAVASAEGDATENVSRLASGVTRTRKSTTSRVGKDGNVVESITEVEEETGPVLAANVFLLERRFSERWARPMQIEVRTADTDPEATPESPLPRLVAALEAMEARARETERLLADG